MEATNLRQVNEELHALVQQVSALQSVIENYDHEEEDLPDEIGVMLDRSSAAIGLGCDLLCDTRDRAGDLAAQGEGS